MKYPIARILVLATAAALCTSSALAEDSGVIKYRQATMRAMAGNLGAASVLAKGEFMAPGGHLDAQVNALTTTAKLVGDLFPANSGQGQTAALPAIWQNPADFAKAVAALDAAAATLSATPTSKLEEIGAALGAVGKACGGCHGPFREKKM